MCDITSMGDMSAARTTIPMGIGLPAEDVVVLGPVEDFRSDLTTSLTPLLRDLFLAAGVRRGIRLVVLTHTHTHIERRTQLCRVGNELALLRTLVRTFFHTLQYLLPNLFIRQWIRKRHRSSQ